mgnify:CR=1 FL=1
MKKTILFITLLLLFFGANAQQCDPDPNVPAIAGIYPDSATGLSNAIVGQAYEQVMTIVTPLDTTVEILGQNIPVTITDITLTSLTGLPASFDYYCNGGNCSFSGGSTSCAVLFSSGPDTSEVGIHPITINTTTSVDAGLFGTQTQDDQVDYYYIEVINSSSTATINKFDKLTFELKQIFPNPVNNQSRIQFVVGESNNIVFSVFNYLGEKINEEIIFANRGVNNILINSNDYSNGIYLYSISNSNKMITKRMVIAN